jgi:methionine aminopeptidase
MDQSLVNDFDRAQREGFNVLSRLVKQLEEGMSEWEISELARTLCKDSGFNSWFHPPEVQVGKNTTSNKIWKIPSKKLTLKKGDPVIIDLGPSDGTVYADVGTTVIFHGDDTPFIDVARECVQATAGFASKYKTVGELFVFAQAWAVNKRLTLASSRSIGHAILPNTGPLAFNYPRSAHAATWLRRYQMRFLNPTQLRGIWAIRPLVSDGSQAAAFEEMIFVSEDEFRLLGRDDLSEVGMLPKI